METRNGLVIDATVREASGMAEREAALAMLGDLPAEQRASVGADKAYDTHDFIEDLRVLGVTPHVSQNRSRRGGSSIDARTTRHAGYAVSQRIRTN